MSVSALNEVLNEGAKHSQQVGSEYLAIENLRKGQVLNGFFVDCKTREALDAETGALKEMRTVSFLLIDEELRSIKHYVSAGIVLCEAFGHGGIAPYTAVRLEYLGSKSTSGGKKTAQWKPYILPVNLSDHFDKLPPMIKAMIDQRAVKASAINYQQELTNEPKLISADVN